MIAETRRIFGKAAARAQWVEFGYTDHSPHLPASGGVSDLDDPDGEDIGPVAIGAVRTFLQENRGQFIPVTGARVALERGERPAGFIGTRGDFLFLDDAWAEATAGLDPRAAADALAEAGYLLKDAAGKRKRAEWVGGKSMRVWVVCRGLLTDGLDA